ncbi:MAG TPA: amylo-alpha-1,6-glucosidase [Nitrospiraceae bacterium]|nr:amylo-alpha-1,6-glucosidase [Nitrospiraceae bacterium]
MKLSRIAAVDCQNLQRALSLEWLEPNGRGGFASGTVAGPNTRRYHALLLTARRPPVDRVVLVNHLEEWAEVGDNGQPLSTTLYPEAVHPEGYRFCTDFISDPWPTWTYNVAGIRMTREVLCIRGRDLVVVRWRAAEGSRNVVLKLRPMLSGRDYHATHHANSALQSEAQAEKGLVSWRPYQDLPAVHAHHGGEYSHQPEWFYRVQFPVEQARGLDGEEDWWSPGEFRLDLSETGQAWLAFTTEAIESLEVPELLEAERRRRELVASEAPKGDRLAEALWRATDAFVAERGEQQTVIAGYPWFTDWGRDAFISLPGLCLVTGRYDTARQVLQAFADHVSQGMIPNRFPDAGEQPEYNTIDASLWYVHAADRYLFYSKDEEFVRLVAWPAVKQIIDGYRTGTRYGIRMDADGLITGGAPGVQLTWMDAKVGDWVVTPRRGKPVEIQALWVRALEIGASLGTKFGEPEFAARCRRDCALASRSFRSRFWYEEGGYLYDVVDGEGGDDASLRPNQIYAVALTGKLLTKEQQRRVVRIVQERLLTPVGLRTLAAHHPQYRLRYEGGVVERDGAYHQGTVWPFLLGPFITAWVNVYGRSEATRRLGRKLLQGLERHLEECCLGQVSEIFDADPPHLPRGCVAQAWSVAEPLRVLLEDRSPSRATRPITSKTAAGTARQRTATRRSRRA